jgi:hypothetical protein
MEISMKMRLILPALLASVAMIPAAHANWFHNARIGINRNVGSAPNPTPQDLREDVMPTVTEIPDDTTVAAGVNPQQPETAKAATTDEPQVRTRTAEAGGTPNAPDAAPSR